MTRGRVSVRWGIILGLGLCVWTLALHALGLYTTRIGAGQIADALAIALPVIAVGLALREQRLARGRGLRIAESAATGLGVAVVSTPIIVGFLLWYHHVLNPGWVDYLVNWKTATMAAADAAPAEIAAAVDALRASGTDQAQVVGGVIGGIVLPTIISLVLHLYFRGGPK